MGFKATFGCFTSESTYETECESFWDQRPDVKGHENQPWRILHHRALEATMPHRTKQYLSQMSQAWLQPVDIFYQLHTTCAAAKRLEFTVCGKRS